MLVFDEQRKNEYDRRESCNASRATEKIIWITFDSDNSFVWRE